MLTLLCVDMPAMSLFGYDYRIYTVVLKCGSGYGLYFNDRKVQLLQGRRVCIDLPSSDLHLIFQRFSVLTSISNTSMP